MSNFIIILLVSFGFTFSALAQVSVDNVNYTPPATEKAQDIKGAIVPATPEQEKELKKDVKEHTTKKKHKKKSKK